MANPYTMPNHSVPLVDPRTGTITQPWARTLQDHEIALKAERAPGRVQPFYLSAADLADAAKFVQAADDPIHAGTGVNDYLGWHLCNGLDGTPAPGDTVLRFSLAAAGLTGGADTHVHGTSLLSADTRVGNDSNLYQKSTAVGFTATRVLTGGAYAASGAAVGGGSSVQGNTDSGSSLPAYYSWVPLMRV